MSLQPYLPHKLHCQRIIQYKQIKMTLTEPRIKSQSSPYIEQVQLTSVEPHYMQKTSRSKLNIEPNQRSLKIQGNKDIDQLLKSKKNAA